MLDAVEDQFLILSVPYVSSAFVPPDPMPSVLENIATSIPITPLSDTLRGLLLGQPVDSSWPAAIGLLLGQPVGSSWPAAILWCLGILVVGRVAAGLPFRRSR